MVGSTRILITRHRLGQYRAGFRVVSTRRPFEWDRRVRFGDVPGEEGGQSPAGDESPGADLAERQIARRHQLVEP
jgi:hypothetical protein